ncbi:MAG: PASTA domain-containing protein [Chloroflexi bacterium]|nr:PASTA domain-containing protein [Chloroflexota bacterium]
MPPLPQVGREANSPLVSASWLVAGVVVVLLLGLGVLLFWNRGGDGDLAVSGPQPVDGSPGLGAEQYVPDGQPPPLPVVEPGIVPDLEAQDVLVAIDALQQAQLPYIVIEAENGDVPADTVFGQSPAPGTEAEDGIVVTLTVSR